MWVKVPKERVQFILNEKKRMFCGIFTETMNSMYGYLFVAKIEIATGSVVWMYKHCANGHNPILFREISTVSVNVLVPKPEDIDPRNILLASMSGATMFEYQPRGLVDVRLKDITDHGIESMVEQGWCTDQSRLVFLMGTKVVRANSIALRAKPTENKAGSGKVKKAAPACSALCLHISTNGRSRPHSF